VPARKVGPLGGGDAPPDEFGDPSYSAFSSGLSGKVSVCTRRFGNWMAVLERVVRIITFCSSCERSVVFFGNRLSPRTMKLRRKLR
jgi:hypothetical protein